MLSLNNPACVEQVLTSESLRCLSIRCPPLRCPPLRLTARDGGGAGGGCWACRSPCWNRMQPPMLPVFSDRRSRKTPTPTEQRWPWRAQSSPRHACGLHARFSLHSRRVGLGLAAASDPWDSRGRLFPADPCAPGRLCGQGAAAFRGQAFGAFRQMTVGTR